MDTVTLSGYIRKKNNIKRTVKDKDCLSFILEVTVDKRKNRFLCVVYDRLITRVDKAVNVGDKILVQGILIEARGGRNGCVIEVVQLELLDFIRYEDKRRNDVKKSENQMIQERLKRIGI